MDQTNNFSTDIAIIGAGPAGCSTSMFLSKMGISHLLFEQKTFPRDKICGDGLSGKAISYLRKIDPALVEKVAADTKHFLPSWGARFVAPGGTVIDIPHPSDNGRSGPPGYVSKRVDFDNFLFNNLDLKYCTVELKSKVIAVNNDDSCIQLTISQNGSISNCRVKLVIDGSGDHSLMSRHEDIPRNKPQHLYAGLRQYYKNVGGIHSGNFIEMHFLKETLPGYLWIFPLPDNKANVGVGMLSSDIHKGKVNLRNLMKNAIQSNSALRRRFKTAEPLEDARGWRLPLGTAAKPLSGERYLLTGDAGSLIDPFTGEGIGNAMTSGYAAAQVASESLARGDFSSDFLKKYDRLINQRLGREFRLGSSLQKLARRPWLFNFVINRIYRSPELQRMFSEMFDDFSIRDRLRSPSFYFRLLFNK